jgi:hypothetical protein
MANEWQTYTQQLHQAEVERSAASELPLDSALLMMARYLISAHRTHPQRQQAHGTRRPAPPVLTNTQYQPNDEFDKQNIRASI